MTEATLVALVPVYVVVDDDGVSKVVVDDEALDLSTARLADCDSTGDADKDAALLSRAVAIADDAEWPSWEFGW